VIALTLLALYLASAGWVRVELQTALRESGKAPRADTQVEFEGMTFANEAARNRFLAIREAETYFPWTQKLPNQVSLIITAMSFGFLGGVIKLLFLTVSSDPEPVRTYASLALSAMTGLVILAISFALPAALTEAEVTVRPVVLLFLCLFGGIFSNHLLLWLQEQFGKLFERKTKTEKL
jgi:hypothetical protein